MILSDWLRSLRARLGFQPKRNKRPRKRTTHALKFESLDPRQMLDGASNDALVVQIPDVPVEMFVLANDDSAGGQLEIVAVTQPSLGIVSVVQGDSAATPATSDTLLFTPAAGFSGAATISYTVQDALGAQSTASVSITIGGNAAPPAAGGPGLPGVAYPLQRGLTLGSEVAFTNTAVGNYRLVQASSTATTSVTPGENDIELTTDRETVWTLTVVSAQAADGSWIYEEALTSTWQTDVVGDDGSTSTLAETYGYVFSGFGDDLGSGYTFTARGTQTGAASFTTTWETDESGGSATNASTRSAYFQVTIINNTALDGTGAGASFGDGYSNSLVTGAGTYWQNALGGSITGTLSLGSHDNYSYSFNTLSNRDEELWTTTGANTGTLDAEDNVTYVGSGIYSNSTETGAAGPGGVITGTINEHGAYTSGQLTTSDAALDAEGLWQPTGGSGTSSADGNAHWSYAGSGTYAYSTEGGSVTGTLAEDGNQHSTYQFSNTLTLATDGTWTETSGLGLVTSDGATNWSYAGGGGYAYAGPDFSITGTIVESGNDNATHHSSRSSQTHLGGVTTQGGTASSQSDGARNFSYAGGGAFSESSAGSSMGGTLTENGQNNSSYLITSNSVLATDGTWTISGVSGTTADGNSHHTYVGAGTYKLRHHRKRCHRHAAAKRRRSSDLRLFNQRRACARVHQQWRRSARAGGAAVFWRTSAVSIGQPGVERHAR